MRRALAVGAVLALAACPRATPAQAPVDAGPAAPPAAAAGPRALAITKDGVGPLGPGAVTTAVLARVFLEGTKDGTIDERTEESEGEIVGRVFAVKRAGETQVLVHVDTGGQLYSVEVLAPVAHADGVRVGDVMAKALGDAPVRCARGTEERSAMVYCARRAAPQILYAAQAPPGTPDGADLAPDVVRALPLAAIVWSPRRS